MAATDATFDLTIIGSGPGGYVAAIRAAQLGLKTACVEMAPLPGGTCLHWGCIPTKALLHAAEVLESSRHAGAFGVRVEPGTLDMAGLHKYKDKVVLSNAKGVEFLFKKNGVTLVPGRGSLLAPNEVRVEQSGGGTKTLESKFVLVATGSTIRALPGVAFDGRQVINSDHALGLPKVPASMIVRCRALLIVGCGRRSTPFGMTAAMYCCPSICATVNQTVISPGFFGTV